MTRSAVRVILACAGLDMAHDVTRADVFNMTAGQKSLSFVAVGDPNNAPDIDTGRGSVDHVYLMGKYDVTAAQYAQFLNAVALTDTYDLYNPSMASAPGACGIIQMGSTDSFTYSVAAGHENFPVNFVSWGDTARFVNWLQNGQPTGAEGPGTTETGTYPLNGAFSSSQLTAAAQRQPGANYFIPSENEWFKSAYYKSGGPNAGYWIFPTQSDSAPSNVLDPNGTNNANYYAGAFTDPVNFVTPVGSFASSPGPYGTFDQGGDVFQWNETSSGLFDFEYRGGACTTDSIDLSKGAFFYNDATLAESAVLGFRVAAVPEPDSISLLLVGCGVLFLTVTKTPAFDSLPWN